MTIYDEILTIGAPSYERIFRHIIDKPEEPCLVHCTGECVQVVKYFIRAF